MSVKIATLLINESVMDNDYFIPCTGQLSNGKKESAFTIMLDSEESTSYKIPRYSHAVIMDGNNVYHFRFFNSTQNI